MKTRIIKYFVLAAFLFLTSALGAQTISVNRVSVKRAISEVEAKTGYSFVFLTKDLRTDAIVSVNANTVEEAVPQIVEGQNVSWSIEGKNVIIRPAEQKTPAQEEQEKQEKQKTFNVNGIVADIDNNPLPGVAVIISGTSVGTITDDRGHFSITMQKPGKLVFSSIGYLNYEIHLADAAEIRVVMKEDMKLLDEVVVVGFATQKKENLTGSVATVSSEQLTGMPVMNVTQALQGQVAGLNISQGSGFLNGKNTTIDVRGLATIGAGSNGGVLVLIDGMEGDLSTINGDDIENISVLKDAAASSIYGSRAPFGVILVTTKKGSKGRASISYSGNYRINSPINIPKLADAYKWGLYFNEASHNSGNGDFISAERLQRVKDYIEGKIDWATRPNPNGTTWSNTYADSNGNMDIYDVLYKSYTSAHEHNVSISGGTDRLNYFVSGNYLSQDGTLNWKLDGYKRINLFGKFEAHPWENVTIGFSSRIIKTDYHQPRHLTDERYAAMGKECWPICPLYDPNGHLFNDTVLRIKEGGQTTNVAKQITNQLDFVYKPLPGWRIVANANYRIGANANTEITLPVYQMSVDGVTPSPDGCWDPRSKIVESMIQHDYVTASIYSDYEKSFNSGHYFKVMAGFQTESYYSRNLAADKTGIVDADVPSIDTSTGETVIPNVPGDEPLEMPSWVQGGYGRWRTAGFFGRLNYNYKEKYLVEVNLRYDGTSRFRSGSRWGLFPSMSIGYNIAKEDFFKDASRYVNNLKIRASVGSLGNQNTNSWYPTYQVMGFSSKSSGWLINGVQMGTAWAPGLVSSSLTWETIISYNIGLDWGLFNNRLTGSFDYYIRNTRNMVGPADELPVILGTAVPVTNNTDLRTQGFEFELMWKDVIGDFSYSIRGVLSDSRSVITKYSNPSNTLGQYYAGKKWGEIWGYTTVGIAKTDEEMEAHLATMPNGGQNTLAYANWGAGDIMYADLNGDGKVDSGSYTVNDHGDLSVIGNRTPRYNFSFDITAQWKGIDARIFLQGVGKRDLFFDQNMFFWGAFGMSSWNCMVLEQHLDFFRDDENSPLGVNLDSYYPRPYFGDKRNTQVQTRYLQNAAYVRLKNLQLGYTLPNSLTSKIKISKLRFFFSGENLLTFTKMTSIFDPETAATNGGSTYPLSRTYSFGMNLTF